MAITMTDTAIQHVRQQLEQRGEGVGIRVGVKTTGCSGMAYVLEFVDDVEVDMDGNISVEFSGEDGDIEKVYMTFGKYKGKPVASIPPYYRKWMIDNITWGPWNIKIKEEIERLHNL